MIGVVVVNRVTRVSTGAIGMLQSRVPFLRRRRRFWCDDGTVVDLWDRWGMVSRGIVTKVRVLRRKMEWNNNVSMIV